MKTCKLGSWKEFEEYISAGDGPDLARPLYRGHASVNWALRTTLERYSNTPFSIRRYNDCLLRIHPALASFTGQGRELEQEVSTSRSAQDAPPNYSFMCHARQHGFPSPLLDWSESPYIALFFAYRHATLEDDVAIYINMVAVPGEPGREPDGAQTAGKPAPCLSVHSGHFMSQCRYTLATKKINNEWFYCSHEEFFARQSEMNKDGLIKLTMPGYLKYDVLKRLQTMDINAFSLYGTEDGLMEKLAFKEILEYSESMMNN